MSELTVKKSKLDGVLIIKPPTIFKDYRGFYIETYNENLYFEAGIKIKFLQDDISISYKNVLRGIHGDNKTNKLISCLFGSFYLVIINCDKQSPNFGKWESFNLSVKNNHQILVPPKHGVAHLITSKKAIFHYKQSTYYDLSSQFTYNWNYPDFDIDWPIDNPILSKRDKDG